jgi:hypothetical protein
MGLISIAQSRSLMTTEKPCVDCRTLIHSSVAIEPHVALRIHTTKVTEQGDTQYYDCRTCGAKLVREQKYNDPHMRWRLL